jgi:hypothetical protein
VLRPLITAAVYGIVFGYLISDSRPGGYLPFGHRDLVFQFFAAADRRPLIVANRGWSPRCTSCGVLLFLRSASCSACTFADAVRDRVTRQIGPVAGCR